MKKITLLFSLFLTAALGWAQDCAQFYAMKQGTKVTMAHYDAKNKLGGYTKSEVISVTGSSNDMTAKMHSTNTNAKGKVDSEFDFDVNCKEGVLFMNVRTLLSGEFSENIDKLKGMEMTMESEDMVAPFGAQPGSTLPEGHLKITMTAGGMQMGTTEFRVYDRKVIAIESITTPAGTFNCVKMEERIEMTQKMGFTLRLAGRNVSWSAPEAGLVKSESFKETGEPSGTTVLESISH